MQETTQNPSFKLFNGRNSATTLDALLLHATNEENLDVAAYLQCAEEAQLARLRIKSRQRTDSQRYNLLRRYVKYQPGDCVQV